MMTEKLTAEIDAVAEELITADLNNLPDLGKLYTCFQNFLQIATDSGCEVAVKPVAAAMELIKSAILNETFDRKKLLNILNATVSCLQHVMRPGSDPVNIVFPQQLFAQLDTPQELRDITVIHAASDTSQQSKVKKPNSLLHDQSDDGILHHFSLPPNLDENMFVDFLNEQNSVLEKAEGDILLLEKNFNKEVMDDVRRIFHTMKSESAVFEITNIALLCHGVEDMLDSEISELPIDKLLLVKDWLKYAYDCLKTSRMLPDVPSTLQAFMSVQELQTSRSSGKKSPQGMEYVINPNAEFDRQSSVISGPLPDMNNACIPDESNSASEQASTILPLVHMDIDLLSDFVSEVQEHIDTIDSRLLVLENEPAEKENLNAVFRVFHTIKGAAGFLALDEISRLAHMTENLLDRARKGELQLSGGRIDIIFEAVDEMKRLIQTIHNAIKAGSSSYASSPTLTPLLNRLQVVASGSQKMPAIEVNQAIRPHTTQALPGNPQQTQSTSIQEKSTRAFTSLTDDGLDQQEHNDNSLLNKGIQQSSKIHESIKIDSVKLDELIDAIGEMVIIESMIKQDPSLTTVASSGLLQNITQMDKITRELQQLAMSLRMIPVKATFQKMARVVRDLAKKSGKKIEFVSSGEDAMLDKSVVDRIGDPLIHLVRNSVDHGIESSSALRLADGKNALGKIELNAFHKGGNINIEIKDDGNGLDKQAILEKAKERGLIRDGQVLSDRELFNFIFLPGFSTAHKVTDVSGRGVGMDVVKRAIDDLRGNVDIISEAGIGTTFSLRLPLTLAIIDGMIVRIGSERYIIPTLSIVEAVRPEHESITVLVNRGEMIAIRDKIIPLFRLAKLFRIENSRQDPEEGIVIVVEDSGKMAGILVDELLGQQSIVIKSMGASMKGLQGVSGGSILSDGRVGIIIDVAGIVKLALSGIVESR